MANSDQQRSNDNVATAAIITAIAAGFPSVQITKETMRVYASTLGDMPVEILKTVAEQCLRECKFFPTIAEICERAFTLCLQPLPSAEEEWQIVRQQMRHVGTHGTPAFANPVTVQCVKALSWYDLCQLELESMHVRFVKEYKERATVATTNDRHRPLRDLRLPAQLQPAAVRGLTD